MLASPWITLFPRLRRPWLRTSLISVSDRMPLLSRAFLIPWTVTGLLSARTYRTSHVEECLSFALGESFWRPLALSFCCLSRSGSLRGLYCISVLLSPGQWNKLEIMSLWLHQICIKYSNTGTYVHRYIPRARYTFVFYRRNDTCHVVLDSALQRGKGKR